MIKFKGFYQYKGQSADKKECDEIAEIKGWKGVDPEESFRFKKKEQMNECGEPKEEDIEKGKEVDLCGADDFSDFVF